MSKLTKFVCKKYLFVFVVVVLLVLLSVVCALKLMTSDFTLGDPVTTVSVNRCKREQDLTDKCFDLKGSVYVVSTNDTEEIGNILADIVKTKNLTANDGFREIDGKTLSKSVETYMTTPNSFVAPTDDKRIAGMLISLAYSGGLFGVYNFPYSSDGHALYVSSFVYDGSSGDSDSLYGIKSEMGATDEQAQIILKKAKELPKDQYLLLIAEQ